MTEEKLQRILDARLPHAFVQLWRTKSKNVQGRLSVPKALASKCEELQHVLNNKGGHFVYIGPIKVQLSKENSPKKKNQTRRKLAALEKKQNEMKAMIEQFQEMLQMQNERMDEESSELPLPSPGREGGFLSSARKRAAPTTISKAKKQKGTAPKKSLQEQMKEKVTNFERNWKPPPSMMKNEVAKSKMRLMEKRKSLEKQRGK